MKDMSVLLLPTIVTHPLPWGHMKVRSAATKEPADLSSSPPLLFPLCPGMFLLPYTFTISLPSTFHIEEGKKESSNIYYRYKQLAAELEPSALWHVEQMTCDLAEQREMPVLTWESRGAVKSLGQPRE